MPPPTPAVSPKEHKPLITRGKVFNVFAREFLAEFLGTWMLVTIGDGVMAGLVLNLSSGGESMISAALGYGAAYAVATLVTGGISGAHVNPAVTLAYCVTGHVNWIQVPIYWAAQYLGAFLGAATVYGIHYECITDYQVHEQNKMDTAAIFTTFPEPVVGYPTAAFDQVVGSMLMMISFGAITDRYNMKISQFLAPMYNGIVMFAVFLSFGFNCGASLNPARDLSPRLFTLFFWPTKDILSPLGFHYWWIPILMPHLGTLLGGLMYLVFVLYHHMRVEPE